MDNGGIVMTDGKVQVPDGERGCGEFGESVCFAIGQSAFIPH